MDNSNHIVSPKPASYNTNSSHINININIDPAQGLKFVLTRYYVDLFKEFLFILEKNKDEHIECLNKLYDNLPEDYKPYVDLADWLTDDKSDRLRKEVLQRGNDAIRKMEIELEKYEIDFKK